MFTTSASCALNVALALWVFKEFHNLIVPSPDTDAKQLGTCGDHIAL